jgi:hypothetical protein
MHWTARLARDPSAAIGRLTRALLLTAVAWAIVGAQSVGLRHRVEHGGSLGWAHPPVALHLHHEHAFAGRESVHDTEVEATETEGAADREHNCAAVDALTVADGPLSAAVIHAAIAPPADRVVAFPDCASGRLAASPFHARAPPAFS